MSRLLFSLILVTLTSTIIAQVQNDDGDKSPVTYGCDQNDLKKEFQELKAAIFDIKSDLNKVQTESTAIQNDWKQVLEKLNGLESEIRKTSDRLSQLEARPIIEQVLEEKVNVLSNQLQMAESQIRRELNDLSRSKRFESLKTPLYDERFNCLQNCTPTEELPRSCTEVNDGNGIYLVHVPNSGLQPFYVSCEKKRTVIQRREDGSINFNRNWHDYKNGFGDLNGEYWLGLDRIHALTKDGQSRLKIWMIDFSLKGKYAEYSDFLIAEENDKYKLDSLGQYKGDFYNGLQMHLGNKFSTFDDDNELQCARNFKSGWWCRNATGSNLNGIYYSYADRKTPYGVQWKPFEVDSSSLYYVAMTLEAKNP